MSLFTVGFAHVTAEMIDGLRENQVGESSSLEYKAALSDRESDLQYLEAVASFANADGGDLLYGVSCRDGLPVDTPGLDAADIDRILQRFESLGRDRLEPRVHRIQMAPRALASGRVILHIRIPRSLDAPHALRTGDRRDFWTRNSSGKHRMSVSEIRRAVARTEDARDAADRWRRDRVDLVERGEGPAQLTGEGRLYVHVVPLADDARIDLSKKTAIDILHKIRPLEWNQIGPRLNFDGLLNADLREGKTASYWFWFDDGRVEMVQSGLVWPGPRARVLISADLERALVCGVEGAMTGLIDLGIFPPWLLMTALTDVQSAVLGLPGERLVGKPIDRSVLVLAAEVIEDVAAEPLALVRPALDRVWRAAAEPRCPSYDESGAYIERRW